MSRNSRLEVHTAELIRSSRGAIVVVMKIPLSLQQRATDTEMVICKLCILKESMVGRWNGFDNYWHRTSEVDRQKETLTHVTSLLISKAAADFFVYFAVRQFVKSPNI